ncbi:MAG: glycosyltransferase family 4 protein [Verrucomicrobiota bacterium]
MHPNSLLMAFSMRAKIHFICNGVFSTSIAGGDFHFLKLAEFAASEGYDLNFFGGHALKEVIKAYELPGTITLTDDAKMPTVKQGALSGQFAMFKDCYHRYRRTMQLRECIAPEDFVYAVSDYWFDVVPAVRCAARRKLMVLHMRAPSFRQVLQGGRPDADARRLASLHYFLSQNLSLRLFRSCRNKKLLHIHPNMKPSLLQMGFRDSELVFISAGFDAKTAEQVPQQSKQFDVIWIGRAHRQKGVADLIATLTHLAGKLPDFNVILIGRLENELKPQIKESSLLKHLTFVERVTEAEKFRLLKASRLFLMPSRYEGSGSSAVREALASGVVVVAYDLDVYRPVFGDLVRYVPAFDLQAFQEAAFDTLVRARAGQIQLDAAAITTLKRTCSWEAVGRHFVEILRTMVV